ncbi:hypothetical protein CN200_19460 [Sinorhizobium meliloti]|uniref:hypothetical protein n=1 Tax=Rhizobium meliloti TaxID=382 RepID=UPI000FD38B91|nr:hypothetical protein [Sinorhizobium meliloti]RVI14597.1 hypothetical protein CN200_19460 [Sinorhizobium meliloti]RVN92956.1 hypothetical protein CN107_05410 [Sinorhizobium meliloti]RVO03045.1 hypothetical protein CN103_25405 [Sinorhizobium meliloti]
MRHPRNVDGEKAKADDHNPTDDPAFYGANSLICTDQGVRGYLQVTNDLFYTVAPKLKLNKWLPDENSTANPIGSVENSLTSLKEQEFSAFAIAVANKLASFDWRTSATPGLDEAKRRAKLVFRGSSGYKELRTQLLEHLSTGEEQVADAALRLMGRK